MKTVAGNLTARVGETNLWAEVKVDTKNMQLAPDWTRSTKIEYWTAKLQMQVDNDWQVKMTDLLNNDSVLQKKMDWLDVRLAWFWDYVSECEKFVSEPENMKKILSDSVASPSVSEGDWGGGSPFQKNININKDRSYFKTKSTLQNKVHSLFFVLLEFQV
jgi:hypothetical protein